MTKGLKALVGVVLVFSLLLSGVGYASLTDTLSVTGTASAEAAKEVYIYDVQFTENNLGTFENITYPSGTVLMADSVTFDANGRASIFVYVRNNSASDMMYYGINTSPAENPGYTALLLDPDSVETGNELDKDGTAYVVGVRGDKDNRTNAVTGAIINKNSTHDGLLLGLTGEPNMTVNDVVLSLHYDEILDDQYWRGYTVSFMEAVTTDGNTTAVATEVTGLDDTRPENVEPLDGNTAMLVTSVTEQGASKGE